jgi:hypothetical protein
MAEAFTLAEMNFPIKFDTFAHHSLLHEFQPVDGRVDRYGTSTHYHMSPLERINKLLRMLMKQFKHLAKHLMLSYMRMVMLEVQRSLLPATFFPSNVRHMRHMDCLLPEYMTPSGKLRYSFTGREKTVTLTPTERKLLHAFFLVECPVYRSAHEKFEQVSCCLNLIVYP